MWAFVTALFPRIIHVVACISTSFPFTAEYYSIVWACHVLFIHLLMDIWVIATFSYYNPAVNICV